MVVAINILKFLCCDLPILKNVFNDRSRSFRLHTLQQVLRILAGSSFCSFQSELLLNLRYSITSLPIIQALH